MAIAASSLPSKLAPKKKSVEAPSKAKPAALKPRQQAREQEPLPEAPEIEKAVLGAIFDNAEVGFPTFERVGRKGFFADPVHREIYELAKQFFVENGKIDLIGFTADLDTIGRLKPLGGPFVVTDLFTQNVPSSYLEYYVDQLRDFYLRRQIIKQSFAQAKRAKTEQNIADLIADMGRSQQTLEGVNITNITLCDTAQYLNGNCPPLPAEIVYHILHQGSKMIVGGTSKGRKTMALLDLALSVATGEEWWGFRTRLGPVCYINFEIQDAFFYYRANAICAKKSIHISEGMFYAWNLRGRGEGIENLLEEILTVLKQVPFVLIIIDPIYKALGARDENRAGDVASMLNEIEKIAVQSGAAVAFGAHYSKGNQSMKESIDRIGGSGVFARDPDSILTMTAHEEEECFTVEATLRNFPPLRPFVIKWEWPLFSRQDSDPMRLKKARGGSGQFQEKFPNTLLLDKLSVIHGLAPKVAVKELHEMSNVSRRTVYRMKEELEAKKLLVVRDNKWFRANKEERNGCAKD